MTLTQAAEMTREIIVEQDVPATMRDGVVLRANIYRPAGDERWPVLLERLPYGKNTPLAHNPFDLARMASRGYVVIAQDCRGRFASEGVWEPYIHEAQDGVDTIAWAANLPYSNGQVAMFGGSYFGFTQWAAALEQPEALRAIAPFITWNDPLNGWVYRGGALELGKVANWQLMMTADALAKRYQHNAEQATKLVNTCQQELAELGTRGYWSLPLHDFAPLKRFEQTKLFNEMLAHPLDREYFASETILGKHSQVQVPALNTGGWYDIFAQDTLTNFHLMREQGSTPLARQSKLIMGPWSHMNRGSLIGERDFGPAADGTTLDLSSSLEWEQARWFAHWLKGEENGVETEAPVKLFVMGANVWRDEYEWPLARAMETRYYLHSQGHANTRSGDGLLSTTTPGDEPVDQYTYDPAQPVPTHGGATLMTAEYPAGPYDQRTIEERSDVLVFSTPTLEEDVEVTGPISVHLWASSSAPDTDFVARLVDVFPDGFACNLTDGIVRARYRRGDAQAELLEPVRPYEFIIDLWSTSNVFQRGHRVRLDITSSNFPRWDRNPNTGHELGTDAELRIAHQTILHAAAHPSYVLLPIIPMEEERPARGC